MEEKFEREGKQFAKDDLMSKNVKDIIKKKLKGRKILFSDVQRNLPTFIKLSSDDYYEIKLIKDLPDMKYICYSNQKNNSSYGTYAETWDEILIEMQLKLYDSGLLKVDYIDNYYY